MQAVKCNDGTVILTMSPDEACVISSAMGNAARREYSTRIVCEQAARMSDEIYKTAAGRTPAQSTIACSDLLEDATVWRERAQTSAAELLTAQDDLEFVISGERPNGTEPSC